jgi:uncharacterized protein YlxW (UPF0749 family)
MSLLAELVEGSLDSGYRRAAEQGPRPRRPGRVVPVLVVLGLLTGAAVVQVRARARDRSGQAALVREVERSTAASAALERQLRTLRGQLAAEQAAALAGTSPGRATTDTLHDLEVQAGTVPVEGPGLQVRLDDAPERADAAVVQRGGTAGSGRVLDRDLQDAVNGLWAAGAEAVSVNDQRLTSLTSIRAAGEAVLVDFRPLRSPYLLRAVGPAGELGARFAAGAAGRRLATYPARYGIAVHVSPADRLVLPAAGVPELPEVRR